MGAGAIIVPWTNLGAAPRSNEPPLAGLGLIAAGTPLIWLGFQDQRKALRPSTTFGVRVGRMTSVQVRRSW